MENEAKPTWFRKMGKKLFIDIIIVGILLAIAVVALEWMMARRTDGAIAVVEINGERVCEYPLSENASYTLNGGSNILVIEDGVAFIIEADCPDRTCVRRGGIRYTGEDIICLPNKVRVFIEGAAEEIV